MSIFLDTGKFDEIKKYLSYGVIDGVTTNPSILVSEGLKPGIKNLEIQSKKVAKLLKKLPLSIEVTSNNYKEMLNQLGGIQGFNNMDYYQKKAAADMLGISTGELQKQLNPIIIMVISCLFYVFMHITVKYFSK